MKEEERIKESVATYLLLQYPDVVYRFDIGADIHLPIGLAKKSKRIHKHKRGYPDLFIAEPRGNYHGLFIEIKTDSGKVFKKNGILRNNQHVIEQDVFLHILRDKGYMAEFGFGFDHIKELIDNYLK
jgi:hypothetical protein